MKSILILTLVWFACTVTVLAQSKTVEKTLSVPSNKKIVLKLKFGDDIKITAWDKKDASVKVTYEINGGKLNDALLLKFESDNASARVEVDFDSELVKNGKAEDCPANEGKGYTTQINGDRSFTCSTINYEIFVPRDTDLTVETINGNIELKGITGPVNAKSISGFVDMSWPEKRGAAVYLKTITGEVYSDLSINLENREKNPVVGYQLKGDVGQGGSAVKLESISNNIYFRKQE